uniref:Uncharacterized protein n=1 Tax=Amphimedon queenslandica TaxID=400682 RepID=A0A1X7SJE9_AMPQE
MLQKVERLSTSGNKLPHHIKGTGNKVAQCMLGLKFDRASRVLVLPDTPIPSIHSRAADIFWGVVGTRWSLHLMTSVLNWIRLKDVLCRICSRSSWRSFLLMRLKRPSRELEVSTTTTI